MIEYLYEGFYNVPWQDEICSTPDGPQDALPFHEAMFAIGDKYQIEDLRVDARSRYSTILAQSKYDQVLSSLLRIYAATQDGGLSVRTILDEFTWRCIRFQIKRTTPQLKEFMKKYPEFAVDFVDSVLGDETIVGLCEDCHNCYGNIVGIRIGKGRVVCSTCDSVHVHVPNY